MIHERESVLQKLSMFFVGCLVVGSPCLADTVALDDALRATYAACVGIDAKLSDLKKMAGINTAITGVGTGVGVGATAVGIVKANKDKELEQVEIELEKLRELEEQHRVPTNQTADDANRFMADVESSWNSIVEDIKKKEAERDKLNQQSKKLGNWRTGLMAGATATNVAGAIIAGNNGTNGFVEEMIDNCKNAVDTLSRSVAQAQLSGQDVTEAQQIVAACREYDTVDISKIAKRARGAMVSSVVGAATGATGTVLSAVANSDSVRDNNTDDGRQKEKNLNTASNVMAGVTTAASATATVFNATQISAIKKVVAVAEKCEGILQ